MSVQITDSGENILFTISGIQFLKAKNSISVRYVDTQTIAVYEYGELWRTFENVSTTVTTPSNTGAADLSTKLAFFFRSIIIYNQNFVGSVTAAITTNEVTLYTFTIPVSKILTNFYSQIDAWFTTGSSANNKFTRIYINNTLAAVRNINSSGIVSSNTQSFLIQQIKTTQLTTQNNATAINNSSSQPFQTLAIDTNTTPLTIDIRAQKGVSTDVITLNAAFVRFNSWEQ